MPYAVEDSEYLKVPLMIPTVYPAEKDDQEAELEAVVSFPSDDEDSVDLKELPEEQLENPGALPSQTRGDDCLESNTRRSERERKLPGKFFDFLTGFRATSAGNLSPSSDPPESFDEIKARDDRQLWLDAVDEELKSMAANKVWKLVPCPAGVKPLQAK